MLEKSLEEYKDTCVQVRDASSAIMTYSSAVVALSGGALIALIKLDQHFDSVVMALIFIVSATITTLILLIIYYKCDSHNRLAAYRGIISSEMIDLPINNVAEVEAMTKDSFPDPTNVYNKKDGITLASFAMCMAHLNRVYKEEQFLLRHYEQPKFNKNKGVFLGMSSHEVELHVAAAFPKRVKIKRSENDEEQVISRLDDDIQIYFFTELMSVLLDLRHGSGFRSIKNFAKNSRRDLREHLKGIFRFSNRSGSWGFPLYVRNTFAYIIYIEIIISILLVINPVDTGYSGNMRWFFYGLYAILLVSWGRYYYVSLRMFRQLTMGSRTTDAYFRQFIPFRLLYVTTIYPDAQPYYIGTEWKQIKK